MPTVAIDQAPTGSHDLNSTKAPTGPSGETPAPETIDATIASGSQCEPFREIIVAECELGLSAKRIHQDLVADHGFDGMNWSVNRCVKSLGAHHEVSVTKSPSAHSQPELIRSQTVRCL